MIARELVLVFIFLSFVAPAAYGDAVYKWVDENGKVQYGNAVPKDMKNKASQVDPKKIQVIERQYFETNRPRDRSEDTPEKKDNVALPASSPVAAQPDVAPASMDGGSQVNDKKKQCEEAWARYRASLECFAPYVTVKRAVKAEGFEHCEVVKQPLEICD